MTHPCAQFGHDWRITASTGWFQCGRAVSHTESKTTKKIHATYCKAVGVCPECLGHVLEGYDVVFCSAHQDCPIRDYPIVERSVPVASSVSFEQQSLF